MLCSSVTDLGRYKACQGYFFLGPQTNFWMTHKGYFFAPRFLCRFYNNLFSQIKLTALHLIFSEVSVLKLASDTLYGNSIVKSNYPDNQDHSGNPCGMQLGYAIEMHARSKISHPSWYWKKTLNLYCRYNVQGLNSPAWQGQSKEISPLSTFWFNCGMAGSDPLEYLLFLCWPVMLRFFSLQVAFSPATLIQDLSSCKSP